MRKQLTAVAAYAAITLVACGASYLMGRSHMANSQLQTSLDAAVAAQQAANTEAGHSAKVSAQVDASAAASSSFTQEASTVVAQRLASNEPKVVYRTKIVKEQCSDEPVSPSPVRPEPADASAAPWRFDVGTVRLLNAARSGNPVDPSSVGNDEGDNAPSTVGIAEFATNDLQVVHRYNALKAKHDALVDWVNHLQDQGYGLCVAAKVDHPYKPLEDP